MALTKASLIDLNGQELILDADADTSITADTDDQIDFKVGGTDRLSLGSDGKLAVTEISHITSGNLEIGNGDEKQVFNATSAFIQFQTNDTEAMRIDSAGHVTKPLQPAVLVSKSGSQLDIAVGSSVTHVFDSEIFDVNGDFSSNTFTAPVTGKYLVNLQVRYQSIPTDMIYIQPYLATSNGTRYMGLFGSGSSWFNSAASYFRDGQSLLIDMDANDTFTVVTVQSGGTQQMDIGGESYLSVALLS